MRPDLILKLLLAGAFMLLLTLVFGRPGVQPALAQVTTDSGVAVLAYQSHGNTLILLATPSRYKVIAAPEYSNFGDVRW